MQRVEMWSTLPTTAAVALQVIYVAMATGGNFSQSFFPHGLARNSIHNLAPSEHEMQQVEVWEEAVSKMMDEWTGGGEKAPASVDWRKQGVLTPVQDMRYCSAAYAFATVAMLESQFKIQHGERKQFSAQQLIDCSVRNMAVNHGCSGGRAKTTFDCIQHQTGLHTADDYPWEGKVGPCRVDLDKMQLQVKGFVATSEEDRIRHFVWKKGPVIAYINPALLINDYPGGVIQHNETTCDSRVSKLTHIVVIVGFGESRSGVKYWIVRNSWGPRWGYGGYFHIERGTNACGIETLVFFFDIE